MADLENSTELLKQALDEIRTSSTLSSATLLKLGKAADALKKDFKESEKAIEGETDQRLSLAKTLKSFAKDMGSAAQAARENREDFRSLKPAVDAFGTAAKYSAAKVGDAIASVGEAISGLSMFLGPKGKIIGMVVGGVSTITGDIMKKYGEAAVEFAQAYGKFALDEVQRVSGAFREIALVGGLAGTSIDGFADQARALGLSMDQYAKLIGRNSETLAASGVTVSQGARVLRQITTAGTAFEQQFFKLGFSFEQQTEFSAKFLGFQRNLTKINFDDTKALSEANRKYLAQVDELARLTGQNRDKVAADLEAMSRELRFGATLAIAEQKGTAGAITKTAKLLETHGSKELAEGFKDIFGGATTERSQALMAATNNRAAAIAEDLENGKINEIEAMRQLQQAVRETRQALGADEFERRVGKLGTVLDPMLVGMRSLSVAQDLNAQTLGKATAEQKSDAEATGKNVQNLFQAQKVLRDFAVQIDEIVMEKLFPTMAQNVRQLTEVLSAGANKLAEILGVKIVREPTAPATPVPPPPITGEQVNQRRQAAGQAPLSLEAAEAQAGREAVQREIERRNRSRRERAQRNAPYGAAGPAQTPASTAPGSDELAGLNIKSAESVGGGAASPKLIELAKKIQEMYPTATFTALNDVYHQVNHVNSKHTRGLALDFTTNPPPMDLAQASEIKRSIQGLGFASVKDEYFADKNRYTTGGHFHAELAYGGVVSGPKSGYPTLLHGTEAVVPLPGGRSIPVEMTGMTDKIGEQMAMMNQQIDRFDQMISLLQSSVDTQQKIYRATAG
jgi:hypothetical protein